MQLLTPTFGSCLPKQIQRVLVGAITCMLVIIYLSVAGAFGDIGDVSSQRPGWARQKFPRKIWQMWKVPALDFEYKESEVARTWLAMNPEYRYEVLTDDNADDYVLTHFGPFGINRPDIVQTYQAIRAKIIKADFLRYLVMYVDGGVYTDIDVEALRPLRTFIPERYDERELDMVIGVEIDEPELKNHTILGQKSQSFCQWTFVSKPKLPVILRLIENIMKWLDDVARVQDVSISEISLDFDEVITGTGPSAFTKAILTEMSLRTGKRVTWDMFHNMAESKEVGGILVLTVEAFAAGQGHSNSGNHDSRAALVKHHYHASKWPSEHPRKSHPIYGEVELCNWDKACVKAWDENVAAFEQLSSEDQAGAISLQKTGGV
ncbi:hypothetical protein FQN57_002851 [Myotisia sp. PD_48]|nr:hypothetical protein FQN57_002851 [Myotisia sp. PD_48]